MRGDLGKFSQDRSIEEAARSFLFAEISDFYRLDASLKLNPKQRSELGQFLTPTPICRFMASLFFDLTGDLHILDPGAGVGSLTAALVERLCDTEANPNSVNLVAYEIEPLLVNYLRCTMADSQALCESVGIKAQSTIFEDDFILNHPESQKGELGNRTSLGDNFFTHVIMNPPYKKIKSLSAHRLALRKAGIETSNLYSAFMYLAALRLRRGGEMVAIVPRSFCNGPYFKRFRIQFFSLMALRHIHVFEKRNSVFRGDEVLQENIILHAVKGATPSKIVITSSQGGNFKCDQVNYSCFSEDLTQRKVDYNCVISENDPNRFVRIATNNLEQWVVDRMANFSATLSDLGVEVSTGPVVDFRLKDDLCFTPEDGAVPLLYTAHFQGGNIEWPKCMKKPNAIYVTEKSRKWLWKNEGHFVITKRFSAKEERRRIVAFVYSSELSSKLIGFENHLNVFHTNQVGFSPNLAKGLFVYLNCSLVDRYFRQFNGHTQVNATDLRSLKYPDKHTLERIGKRIDSLALAQEDIDNIIELEISHMTQDTNPLLAQQKIDEALKILTAFCLPRGQQNERSALTLLALLNLSPEKQWQEIEKPLIGITPIMEFVYEFYGREYAPNTRETFRRQTMHQFVEAGVALYNPDKPDRPVNSPKACYQISEEVFQVITKFGTEDWESALSSYLKRQESLAAKWARHRHMQMIPVVVADGSEIKLTPGDHSKLIKAIITQFAPRFAPGAEVIYLGDTGEKVGYFQEERLAELGVTIDQHGKMPDVVLYFGFKDWLLLIESVTSHGPVDSKRHNELASVFKDATSGIVYVTAFPNRTIMARFLGEISWETEVWCEDAPTHLIHFNGEHLLSPYIKNIDEDGI